jgi:iron complex outermembrane receptor protein
MDLPGGPLQFALGGSIRYEGVDSPSGNSDINGPTQRYFTLNAFGTSGNRTISSAFFELDACRSPTGSASTLRAVMTATRAVRTLFLAEGRPEGHADQAAHVSAVPTRRASVSRRSAKRTLCRPPATSRRPRAPVHRCVSAQYGCTVANFTACPAYVKQSYGLTTLASPNLKPEKSRSFTPARLRADARRLVHGRLLQHQEDRTRSLRRIPVQRRCRLIMPAPRSIRPSRSSPMRRTSTTRPPSRAWRSSSRP